VTDVLPGGLLGMATALVAIPSVSHHEALLADGVEAALRCCPWLTVERVGDNVVARTEFGRPTRLLLAGHLDTVPPVGGNEEPRVEDGVLYGVGASDMKGGLAVFLHLAGTVAEPATDLTWVFYVAEEVEREHNGLRHLARIRPELLQADAAILGEPTDGVVEAGCQGTLRLRIELTGQRAHTARPWTGRNAVHRLAPLLADVAAYEGRRPELDGCVYGEQLQAVAVDGGVAGNVVPDRVALTLNHRFAPDRSAAQAEAAVRELLADHLEPEDRWTLVDAAPGALPSLDHPVLARLVEATGAAPRAKLGWTDVSLLWELGVPAANFGPGDPLLAHTPGEFVTTSQLEQAAAVLGDVLRGG
jgi:succinyl-diaminopimelate desuccinylase